ncbi:hypothetical protein MSG28_012626, partial [Choristoneura fumiferana]
PEFSKPPSSPVPDAGASKAAYKSGEILDMPPPITPSRVKRELPEYRLDKDTNMRIFNVSY